MKAKEIATFQQFSPNLSPNAKNDVNPDLQRAASDIVAPLAGTVARATIGVNPLDITSAEVDIETPAKLRPDLLELVISFVSVRITRGPSFSGAEHA